jgi:two-component system, cell cycle sensor histidine kinase and response regulator CckA
MASDTGNGVEVRLPADESQVPFRSVVMAMAEGVVFRDALGRVTFINPTAERILDLPASRALGRGFEDFEVDAIREDGTPFPLGEHPARIALETGEPTIGMVLGLKGRNGKITWVSVNSEPLVREGETAPYAVVSTFADVTAQREAEIALVESEKLFRTLVENQSEGIGIVDLEERFLFTNRAGEQILGVAPGGMVGRSLLEFLAPDAVAVIEEQNRTRSAGVRSQYELEIIRESDQARRTILVSAAPQFDASGKIVATFGIFSDITDRAAVERALQENEARLRITFDQAPIGAVVVGLDGRFVQVNDALCRMLQCTSSELIGKSFKIITHPDHVEADESNALFLVEGLIEQYSTESRYARKDGQVLWAHLTARCARDASGRALYILAMVEDITERKKAEAERARLQAQFLQSQKMESVGRLAGGVAHDFNNLLMVINGYSAMVVDRMSPDDPARNLIAEVYKAGESAAALVRQLLAFSRKQVLQQELVDLNEMICEMEKTLLRLVGEDVEIVTNLKPTLNLVLADRHQMEQVILNLAINARDAMPRGGKLTLQTGHERWNNSCPRCLAEVRPGAYVHLLVRDTGTGIDEQTRQHLFEPFFTTKEVGQGTGLGLATVHGIVMQSGGHIDVESETGAGSGFHVYLPAVAARSLSVVAPHVVAATGGSETILLVEDQPEVRQFAATVLRGLGYAVLQASGGEEALAAYTAHPIDLLLTDVVMPKMSGTDLAARIRARNPALKVLFMSGYSVEVLSWRAEGAANGAFLQKPFAREELAAKVREVLGRPGEAKK